MRLHLLPPTRGFVNDMTRVQGLPGHVNEMILLEFTDIASWLRAFSFIGHDEKDGVECIVGVGKHDL